MIRSWAKALALEKSEPKSAPQAIRHTVVILLHILLRISHLTAGLIDSILSTLRRHGKHFRLGPTRRRHSATVRRRRGSPASLDLPRFGCYDKQRVRAVLAARRNRI